MESESQAGLKGRRLAADEVQAHCRTGVVHTP
jgi:hypothetical protein